MEEKLDKQQTVARLAVCAVAAGVLWALLTKAGDKLPFLQPYLPWLEENKIQAIAIVAAVLFGLSLVVLPPAPKEEPSPCDGYERACDLP